MKSIRKSTAAILLSGLMVWMMAFSCASAITQLQRYAPIGIAAFDGAINIISPAPGSPLQIDKVLVDQAWAVLDQALTNYQNAPASSKQDALSKVIVALQAVQAGVQQELTAFGVSGVVDEAVSAALVLIIATLSSIEANLQPSPTPVAKKKEAKLATVKGTQFAINGDPAKFRAQFNAIMIAGGHADHQLK